MLAIEMACRQKDLALHDCRREPVGEFERSGGTKRPNCTLRKCWHASALVITSLRGIRFMRGVLRIARRQPRPK